MVLLFHQKFLKMKGFQWLVQPVLDWLSATESFTTNVDHTVEYSRKYNREASTRLLPPLRHSPIPKRCFVVIDFDNTFLKGKRNSPKVAQALERYRERLLASHYCADGLLSSSVAEAAHVIATELFNDHNFLVQFINALETRGHQVRIASFSHGSTDIRVQPWLHKSTSDIDLATNPLGSFKTMPIKHEISTTLTAKVGPFQPLTPSQMGIDTVTECLLSSHSSVVDRPPTVHSGVDGGGLPTLAAPEFYKPSEFPNASIQYSSFLDGSGSRRVSHSNTDEEVGPPMIRNAISYATELREQREAALDAGQSSSPEVIPFERFAVHDILDLLDALSPNRQCLREGCHVLAWRGDSTMNKNEHIQALQAHFHDQLQTDPSLAALNNLPVVLIDDDCTNVRDAKAAGFEAFHCPGGLTREWFAESTELQQMLNVFVGCDL